MLCEWPEQPPPRGGGHEVLDGTGLRVLAKAAAGEVMPRRGLLGAKLGHHVSRLCLGLTKD